MLDRYNLSEANFPLLRANYDVMDFGGEARVKGPAFVDESLKARDYLKKHPYIPALDKWNREHPYLRGHPDLTHEWMRKQNELDSLRKSYLEKRRQEKLKELREQMRKMENSGFVRKMGESDGFLDRLWTKCYEENNSAI